MQKAKKVSKDVQSKRVTQNSRPPIVVVLGHVDHGKTTLLDKIRKTNTQEKEAGGITQSIGASVIKTKAGKKVTFIDTPGHSAFANMRSQGAKVADIAILVVAADDGVKPQTKETLEYILASQLPFIVAATKCDLQTASSEKVRSGLEKEGVLFEGKGGDTPLVSVSGKTGKGLDELLEMITLLSELNEIKGDSNASLEAVVIETKKTKAGPTVSVIVRNGTLKVRNKIATGTQEIVIKSLFNDQGKSVSEVLPGFPAKILGFSDLPRVGEKLWNKTKETVLRKVTAGPLKKYEEKPIQVYQEKPIKDVSGAQELPVVIKAATAGSLEAVIANLPKKVFVVGSSVGDVCESDVFLAKSASVNIFAFESRVSNKIKKFAETEGVEIFGFDIIYELFEKLEEILEQGKVKILGKAKVLKIFPFNKQKVAGCKVNEGRLAKGDAIIIERDKKELGEAKIVSMKKEKTEIDSAKAGEECGIIFVPQLDFEAGDVLISVRK